VVITAHNPYGQVDPAIIQPYSGLGPIKKTRGKNNCIGGFTGGVKPSARPLSNQVDDSPDTPIHPVQILAYPGFSNRGFADVVNIGAQITVSGPRTPS
jgi:hypothetical protein